MLAGLVLALGVTAAAADAVVVRSLTSTRYATLFQLPRRIQVEPRIQLPARQTPRIVCGMTLIPADPNIDARMRVQVPRTPEHKLRTMRPPVCAD